jgi:cytoskeletal protein CcmA (bactofilin family)
MGVFSTKDKSTVNQQAITTLISEGSTVSGNVNAPAVARIDGVITGDVTVTEGLILGEKGVIDGNVVTKNMVVYGVINGNITAQTLEIKATGKITGDIVTGTLLVETGGVYNGRLSMSVPGAKQAK